MSGLLDPRPQRGGSPDLDVLWDELAHWPGYYVTEISAGGTSSSRDRDDRFRPDSGWFQTHESGSWVVEVEQEGWEPRDRWFEWGDSIKAAADKLGAHLASIRADPHSDHVNSSYHESCFVIGCADCQREAHDLFQDAVEWGEPLPGLYRLPTVPA